MTSLFEPNSDAFRDDPYATYRRLRDEAPVYHDEQSGLWLLTRYHDIERALADYATFSSSRGNAIVDSPQRVGKTLGSMDPPRHDELRRVIQRALAPSRVQAMLGVVKELSRRRMGELQERKSIDFVEDFARPLIFSALGIMLGLDETTAVEAEHLARNLFEGHGGPMGNALPAEDFVEIWKFLGGELAKRTASPAEDLFSVLLAAKAEGANLSDEEILGNMSTVLLAGNASLGHFFPNIIHALWQHPDQRRAVMQDPELLPAMIEETVRWDTSTQSFARQVMNDVEIDGLTIPAGSRVVLFYGSANRDERVVESPDTFDIGRKRIRHFGFGLGPHICAGSTMARMVCRTILEDLLPFLGDYELDIANSRRAHHVMVRGFKSLPLVRQ